MKNAAFAVLIAGVVIAPVPARRAIAGMQSDLQSVNVVLKIEGAPSTMLKIKSVRGKTYFFGADTQTESPIELTEGALTSTLDVPTNAEGPLNFEATALVTFDDDTTCKYSAEANTSVAPDHPTVVMRGVCG